MTGDQITSPYLFFQIGRSSSKKASWSDLEEKRGAEGGGDSSGHSLVQHISMAQS